MIIFGMIWGTLCIASGLFAVLTVDTDTTMGSMSLGFACGIAIYAGFKEIRDAVRSAARDDS